MRELGQMYNKKTTKKEEGESVSGEREKKGGKEVLSEREKRGRENG